MAKIKSDDCSARGHSQWMVVHEVKESDGEIAELKDEWC